MNVLSATSSEAERALASSLSVKLREPVAHEAQPAPAQSSYVQLPRTPVPPGVRYVGAPPPLPDVDTSEGLGAGLWEQLLPWCMTVTGTDGAFVMDQHGLVVAEAGTLPVDDIEAIGARLVLTMEQVDMMEGFGRPGGSMAIEIGDVCVSTVRVTLDAERWLLVALVGHDLLPRATRQLVVQGLTAALKG